MFPIPSPADKEITSKSQCFGILLFILIPLFNLCVLGLLIMWEVKYIGVNKKTMRNPKNQVIVTLTFLQLLIFIHYTMAEDVARVFFQTMEDGCRTVCFFLMMNFFIKSAGRLLRNKALWYKIYRILWPMALTLFLISIVSMIYSASKY